MKSWIWGNKERGAGMPKVFGFDYKDLVVLNTDSLTK